MSKVNRKQKAELLLERRKKDSCEGCKGLKGKLRLAQEEMNAIHEQYLDCKQQKVQEANNAIIKLN